MAGMNYFDYNRTNTAILKFEAVKVAGIAYISMHKHKAYKE